MFRDFFSVYWEHRPLTTCILAVQSFFFLSCIFWGFWSKTNNVMNWQVPIGIAPSSAVSPNCSGSKVNRLDGSDSDNVTMTNDLRLVTSVNRHWIALIALTCIVLKHARVKLQFLFPMEILWNKLLSKIFQQWLKLLTQIVSLSRNW